MRRIVKGLLMGVGLGLSAQAPSGIQWRTEVDLLPFATGGWYASLGAGRGPWQLRLVAAEVKIPDSFVAEGWEEARTRAQALLLDRYFRPGRVGPWIGGGFERWDEELQWGQGPERVRLESLQATLGAGWVLSLGKGFSLNPWFAFHQRIAGDREASCSQATYHPKPFQFEASLKIGYTF